MNEIIKNRKERTKWFLNDRFGMFIHWGLYAIPGRGEWVRSIEKISSEEYDRFFDEFDARDYEPKVWAKLAKEAGMKYAVLTAKHHDGFCLFDSKYTDFKSTNTKTKRDLVAEFLEAFREEEIKVGLYFSLIDWRHKDFPHYKHMHHPMRENEEYKNVTHNFNNYLEYMHNQVREICINYGKLDLLWFDFSYGDMKGEKWKATELINMVRELQPTVIVDNRLEESGEKPGSIISLNPTVFSGDFASPEMIIPPEGLVDVDGNSIPWEACITMNNSWGYCPEDKAYKSAKVIIRKLVECVSKNGNMLLNVGPDAKGRIPIESIEILKGIGRWMRENSESIYGCKRSEIDKPEWGYFTKKGNILYAHLFEQCIGPIPISGVKNKIKKARLLSDGREIRVFTPWNAQDYEKYEFINLGRPESSTFLIPDDIDTVIEIELLEE